MTKTNAFSTVALIPNDITGSRTPFVSPVFADGFRKVEELCFKGKSLASEVRALALADWSESQIEPGILFLEHWLNLQFLNAELTQAITELDGRLQHMSSPLDPRYTSCQDASDQDCMATWLLDGRRINILKCRSLLQIAPKVRKTFEAALADTSDQASEVRRFLARMANHALLGTTDYVLHSELLENA